MHEPSVSARPDRGWFLAATVNTVTDQSMKHLPCNVVILQVPVSSLAEIDRHAGWDASRSTAGTAVQYQ